MRLIVSPWAEDFDHFVRSIRHQTLLVAPFIAREPLERLAAILDSSVPPRIELLTNLAVDNLLQGSIDVKAIASFCRMNPRTTIRHLPGLHAKAYVADDHLAIITSGNLTHASLNRNYEYGFHITDRSLVQQISQDLKDYGVLGSEVSLAELDQLTDVSEPLRSARVTIRQKFERQIEVARETLRWLRAGPGESTNAIFSRTILYILRNGPLTTQQIHPLIEGVHPDLCDNSVDRVINGVHFGERWKHMARNAQQGLKNQRLIKYVTGKCQLSQTD